MLKLCIWLNIPSHYQRAFLTALDARDDIELSARYFKSTSKSRAKEGWSDSPDLLPFEQCIESFSSPSEMLETVSDWQNCIHITSQSFNNDFVDFLCENNIKWCHWSEVPGYTLVSTIGFHMPLYKVLRPLSLFLKRREGKCVARHALFAFGQGRLALEAFTRMGIPENKIGPLYYAPAALESMPPNDEIVSFAEGRRIFLSVGALCKRKGIDLLLKSFARLETKDWCLVLCGLDKEKGKYQKLANRLGIQNQVLFLGAISSDQIATIYSSADAFILASRFDGWGAVLNEAASLGLPLIGTDMCGASWHLIRNGDNGFMVKAGSAPALQRAMKAYVDTPELCLRHGKASQGLYFSEFTPKINADRLVQALRRCTS